MFDFEQRPTPPKKVLEKKEKEAPWSRPVMSDQSDHIDAVGYDKIYNALPPNSVWRLFLKTLWLTGRRPGELCYNLRVRDLNFEDNVVTWHILKKHKRKNAKKPVVYQSWQIKPHLPHGRLFVRKCDEELMALFAKWIRIKQLKPEDFIFPFTRQWAWHKITEASKTAGVNAGDHAANPRTMRHSFALGIVKSGDKVEDLIRLQNMLVHSTLRQSLEYAEVTNMETQSLLDKKKAMEDKVRQKAVQPQPKPKPQATSIDWNSM